MSSAAAAIDHAAAAAQGSSNARSPFAWFGGKQRLADAIIDLFPEHDCYVEVFGGGASVLLSKPPARLDVYNDLHLGLVNFFRCLRDRPGELVPLLELTPYSRHEWDIARRTWSRETDAIERARLFYVAVSQAFGSLNMTAGAGAGSGWGGDRLGTAHRSRSASLANRVDHIGRFVDRMRRVQVDNRDWRDCLEQYDAPRCLFYLDPPYLPETRKSGGYLHEMAAADHAELVARVVALEGVAIVSGYDHHVYRPLEDAGFERHETVVWSTAGRRLGDSGEGRRTEVIWASPRAAQPRLFNLATGQGTNAEQLGELAQEPVRAAAGG